MSQIINVDHAHMCNYKSFEITIYYVKMVSIEQSHYRINCDACDRKHLCELYVIYCENGFEQSHYRFVMHAIGKIVNSLIVILCENGFEQLIISLQNCDACDRKIHCEFFVISCENGFEQSHYRIVMHAVEKNIVNSLSYHVKKVSNNLTTEL